MASTPVQHGENRMQYGVPVTLASFPRRYCEVINKRSALEMQKSSNCVISFHDPPDMDAVVRFPFVISGGSNRDTASSDELEAV